MPLTVKDALRLATKDPKFAHELVSKPEDFKAQFNLNDAQIAQLKALADATTKAQSALGVSGGPLGAAAYE